MTQADHTGAQLVCEGLVRHGVDTIFGIPGGAIMPFYHTLWEYRDRLRHVLCRHEQGAGHAATGFARASGRVGVCIATSGPGATNLVTAIADAYMDSTPLIAITGQVTSALLGSDAFQEADVTGITMPITKHSFLVTRASDLPRVMRQAFLIASTGRPGPVVVDITKDAQQERAVPVWDEDLELENRCTTPPPNEDAVKHAAQLLNEAIRPLILAGQGVIQSGASSALRALAERAGIPVVTTLHGLGAFAEHHPLALGMAGMHGAAHVNRALQVCDVLLNLGSRFDDRVTGKVASFAPRAAKIHVDIDASQIGKLIPTQVGIVGDVEDVLRALQPLVHERSHGAWRREIRAMGSQPREPRAAAPEQTPSPHEVLRALNSAIVQHGRTRVVTDVGQHQMWTAQLFDWSTPRTHLTSGGAGTMGFAVPAALGAALACPDETIWVVVGDGGFQMTNQELATIQQEGISNIKIAVINNGYLGMVRQWQELFESRRYSHTRLSGPDFSLLARAYGITAEAVTRVDQVESAIEAAWAHPGTALLDFHVEREANVYPIVPAGRSIGEMLTGAPPS